MEWVYIEGLSFGFICFVLTDNVGVAGFEPTTSSSRTTRATMLRYTPIDVQNSFCLKK